MLVICRLTAFIPNRNFLVRTLGEFSRAMVRISAKRSRYKIPIARQTLIAKKLRLGF